MSEYKDLENITKSNMHENDLNKVVFHSKEDMAGGHYLQKGEHILRTDIKSDYSDINDILELSCPQFSRQLLSSQNTAFHTSWVTVRHYYHGVVLGCRKTQYNRIFQLEHQPLF
jgi:hypothetical protein